MTQTVSRPNALERVNHASKERNLEMKKNAAPTRPKGRNAHHQQLIDLELDDRDLDQLADYFALAFEYSTEQITVLVALLDRLAAVEKSPEVHVEDIVYFLSRRLFAKTMEGEKAADRFHQAARRRASRILYGGAD
jgi:hypothetical protein